MSDSTCIHCQEKDRIIAELRHQIGTDFMAGVVIEKDKWIAELEAKVEKMGRFVRTVNEVCGKEAKMSERLIEARRIISHYQTHIAYLNTDFILAVEKWLADNP